ncbi:MAG: hypothetical protein Mars2KO_20250 [Maribacter sp.]
MSLKVKKKRAVVVYDCIQKAISEKNDFIYLKKSIVPIESFPFEKLYGVICDIGDSTVHTSGIPNEMILQTDLNRKVPNIVFDNGGQIAYFSPEDYGTKENVLTIIKLFNTLPSSNITLYTTQEIYDYLNAFSNDNINFYCYENIADLTISASVVITYGYCVRSFIQQKMPTIVIGPCGLGGWVTPDNLNYLIKENFIGRPGGRPNEVIPVEILADEFLEIKETEDVFKVLDRNEQSLRSYVGSLQNLKIDSCIEQFKSIHTQLHDTSQRWLLRLTLASNVLTVKNESLTFIQRESLNDLLFSLPESDLQLLEDLKNNVTCEYLCKKNKLDEQEFWDIIKPLWERKAIVFHHEIS